MHFYALLYPVVQFVGQEKEYYGTRLARCGETTCMRQNLYNLNLIYLFIGYTGRTRRSRIKSSVPPVKNLEDGLQRFGWPACRFFQDLVEKRVAHTGRDLRGLNGAPFSVTINGLHSSL